MELIYAILEKLPFAFLQYDFMKNAFLAVIFLAPLFALLGTMAVNNNMAFFSDALGHSALTGIAIGMVLGLKQPLLCMIAFGILLSIAITKVKGADMLSSDSIISVFSSAAMALGVVLLSHVNSFYSCANKTIKNFAYDDYFIPQGSIDDLMSERGVCSAAIVEYIKNENR